MVFLSFLKYFKIYHTNQVTNTIKKWQSIQIAIDEIPYRLKIDAKRLEYNSEDSGEKLHFIRISAMNAEMGEGPYSNIVELRKLTTSLSIFFPRLDRIHIFSKTEFDFCSNSDLFHIKK